MRKKHLYYISASISGFFAIVSVLMAIIAIFGGGYSGWMQILGGLILGTGVPLVISFTCLKFCFHIKNSSEKKFFNIDGFLRFLIAITSCFSGMIVLYGAEAYGLEAISRIHPLEMILVLSPVILLVVRKYINRNNDRSFLIDIIRVWSFLCLLFAGLVLLSAFSASGGADGAALLGVTIGTTMMLFLTFMAWVVVVGPAFMLAKTKSSNSTNPNQGEGSEQLNREGRFCVECGTKSTVGDKYCHSCGVKLVA